MTTTLKRTLLLAAFAHLALELSNNFLPVVYPILIETLQLTFSQIGLIALVSIICGSLFQPLFGYLSDRWGPIGLTAFSVAWTGSVMGLVGFSGTYWVLVLLAGLGGLGSAALHPPGAVIASSSGRGTRRGMAVSVFSVGGNLGSALSPLLIGLSLAWLGMQGTFILLPIALLSGWLLYTQLHRYYLPDRLNEFNEPPESQSEPLSGKNRRAQLIRTGSRVGLSLIVLVVMARSWFEMSFKTYLPIWLESQGWSLKEAGQILFVFLAATSLGSLSGGLLSDRIGRWPVVGLSIALLGITHWLFLVSFGIMQVVFAGLSGVMIGATFPVAIIIAHEMWPRRAGLASSFVMGLGWLPGGIGASVTGQIADRFSLTAGLQTLLLAPVSGLLCVLIFIFLQRRIRQALTLDALDVEAV